MELNLGFNSILALFVAMSVLAAVPSVSVLAVSAKSASFGFVHGACTVAGIVLGDIFFILFVVFGLALLVEAMGPAFVAVKYLGGAYLIWLGILTWRTRRQWSQSQTSDDSSLLSSFMTGLLITLGDQKAVLFYLGFLPVFLNLSSLSAMDIAMVAAITVMAVGGVKLAYAYAASKVGQMRVGNSGRVLNTLAACILFMAGVWIIIRV